MALGSPAELRAASDDVLWEVRAEPLERARHALADHYGAGRPYLVRRDLRVAVPVDDATGPTEILDRADVQVEWARQVAPTLEDVFVSRIASVTPAVLDSGNPSRRSGIPYPWRTAMPRLKRQ